MTLGTALRLANPDRKASTANLPNVTVRILLQQIMDHGLKQHVELTVHDNGSVEIFALDPDGEPIVYLPIVYMPPEEERP